MADFRGYVTAAGQTFEALAKQMGYPVTIGFIEVGDGKLPDSESPIARTQMVNKLKQFPAIVEQDAKNPGQWVATCYIPADDAINGAGYFIREIGCKLINQGDGVLYAYRRVSDDWKPVTTSGEAKSFIYKLRFIPSNGELLTPTIDPSVVLVDKSELARVMNAHESGRHHPDASETEKGFSRHARHDEVIKKPIEAESKKAVLTSEKLWSWAEESGGSMKYIIALWKRVMAEAGYDLIGQFGTANTIETARQVLLSKDGAEVYAWNGAMPVSVSADTDPVSEGFFAISGDLLRNQLVTTSAEAKKRTNYTEGQPVYLIDIGFRFVFKQSRYLIAGQAESEITFDDDLHILIDAGGMLQFDDFSKVRAKQTINAARFAAALKDDTTKLSIDCYGDSITFGQAQENSPGATNEIGSPTGFGDGSTHNHWRFNIHYPQWVASFLANNLLQASHVNNFGYSGDRAISGYLRHRVTSGSLAATIMYGINDCVFGTSSGSQQSGLSGNGTYSVHNYAVALRLFAAKQIMQGKYVTILGTTPFAGSAGFDGSKLASAQLARAYNAAAKQVAAEFGCRYVDMCQDVFAQYGLMEITDEGTHLGPAGLKIAGSRISAALFTLDTENRVSHGSVLLANPMINNRMSRSQSNVLPNITSSTPKGTLDNKPTTMTVGSDFLTIPFYAETGGLVVFVNGVVAASGAVMDIQLDSGALQSDFHFQHDFMPGKPVSAKSVTRHAPFHRDNTNISDPTGPFFIVANRGWHTLSIRKEAGESTPSIDSLSFESLESVLASDVNGVSATAVWADGGYDATASRGIASMSVPYQGGIQVTFKTPRVNDTYTVAVTATFPGAGVMYRVMRLTTGFTVEFLYGSGSGAGMEFNPETPEDATFSVIGGR
ncbi:GDSL-type esterase/lipase family protein [Aeromonas veronii]|uniref:GDSL-type esterase/lipase family protein n=1 Tax=Aeromonas veronii TaxID=654 RepID=UPI00406BEDD4